VGAGIGGLTAGALLAKKGLDVAILEQHIIPGGSVTAFKRKGFVFDAGACMFFGFGKSGSMNYHTQVMEQLGLDIEMLDMPTHYTLVSPEDRFSVWREKDRYLDELCRAFPHEARGIRAYYEEMGRIYQAIVKSPLRPIEFSLGMFIAFLKNIGGLTMLLTRMKTTTLEIMRKHIRDEKLKQVFDLESLAFSYLDSSECPAILTAIILHDRHVGGVRYPKGGSQALPDKLVEAGASSTGRGWRR
jgi:prolycopene isomerase